MAASKKALESDLENGRIPTQQTPSQREPHNNEQPAQTCSNTYEVLMDERSGLYVEDRIVKVIDRSSRLHGLVEPDSSVLEVNGTALSDSIAFDEAFWQTELPVKLVLQRPFKNEHPSLEMQFATPDITKEILVNLIICYFSVFTDMFGMFVTNPVLPFLQPVMGFDETYLGLLNSLYNASSVLGAVLIGYLMTKYGTRVAILFSLLGSACTLAAQGLLIQLVTLAEDPTDPTYYLVFSALRIAAGATGSSMPVVLTYIGMKVPSKEKPKHMAITSSCMTIAIVVGPIVGGTLANFTPRFALPFYCGAAFALSFFLVALFALGNAKKTVNAGKAERFSKPLRALLFIGPLKMLTYGAYIIMGPAYMMWKFNMQPEEVGSVLSLHGLSAATNQLLIVPFLVKRLGPERVLLLASSLLVVGSSVIGLMPTWWSFQLVVSLIYGLGFSAFMTSMNISCDKFATNATRPAMNSTLFMIDQFSLFLSGALFGKMLEIARKSSWSAVFWYVDCGIASTLFLSTVMVYFCILVPSSAAGKADLEKTKLAKSQHEVNPLLVEEAEPEDSDYLEFGKHVIGLMRSRHWAWRKKREYCKEMLDTFIVDLPTDTWEHRMDVLWDLRGNVKQSYKSRQDIDRFYEELCQFV